MFQINKIAKDVLATLLRFPVPIISAVLAFAFIVIEIHWNTNTGADKKDFTYIKLFLECVSGISYFIAVDFYSEAKKIEWSTKTGLYILGFCIMGMHYYSITPGMFDSEPVFVSRYLIFISCFHLLVSCLAFYQKSEIQNFWQFNYFLFIKLLTALAYTATLFAGLGSALLAIDKLFKVDLDPNYYTDLFLFILLIVNTIIFLYFIPKSFDVFAARQSFKKSIRIFVQYILLPIVAVYFIIIYLYLFQIIISNTIPSGWVCIPVLIFSMVGILAYLLIYPIRLDENNRIIYIFSKYFFYILLPLLSLYFIAIIKRILPYGITEDRYLVLMLGVWLFIISIYIIISKVDNIIVIPVSLFLILFISAIGPWGMFQLSVQNQVRRLELLLKKNHLLVDNKLVTPAKDFKIPEANANSIRSILNYLNKRGEIKQIQSWLNESEQKILADAIINNELNAVNAIFTNINITQQTEYEHLKFTPNRRFLYEIPIASHTNSLLVSFDNKAEGVYKAAWLDSNLCIFKQNDTLVNHPIIPFIDFLKKWSLRTDSIESKKNPLDAKVTIIAADPYKEYSLHNDSLTLSTEQYKIYINLIEFTRKDSALHLNQVQGLLLYHEN
ncbi:MAG: DUF4153 domain-containing protein [Bacteroidetes bacterium]|nr:DUF4153 domain-containing protein [Bacteroidota bacterium]